VQLKSSLIGKDYPTEVPFTVMSTKKYPITKMYTVNGTIALQIMHYCCLQMVSRFLLTVSKILKPPSPVQGVRLPTIMFHLASASSTLSSVSIRRFDSGFLASNDPAYINSGPTENYRNRVLHLQFFRSSPYFTCKPSSHIRTMHEHSLSSCAAYPTWHIHDTGNNKTE
jgi:hypothetical protein